MDEHLNNAENEILWNLLANPADNGHLYADNLLLLATDFPQSGLLHALLSRADSRQNISHAAAYFNPKALYVLVNTPESLAAVTNSQIIQQLSDTVNYMVVEDNDLAQVEEERQIKDINNTDEEGCLSTESETIADEADHTSPVHDANTEAVESQETTENVREDELITGTPSFELAGSPHGIDDDVYDEIVCIEDISFTQVAKPDEVIQPEKAPIIDEEELPGEAVDLSRTEPAIQKERALNMDDEAEKLIVGNIAATDYFVFDRAFNERKQTEAEPLASASDAVSAPAGNRAISTEENKEVSKYHDDTMPYTFMWWLNKTRKEHAGIYQPFKLDTSQAIRQAGADELQQQYYENIFHLSSVEELDRSTPQFPIEFDPKSKEDRIIKRFIVEEPHITPPSGDKLDNENKARKSAEDQDEMVTETLAHIYIDQMLYHKAINTYKKLMLKFPEKSRYFADQIEQLERKTH